jgi:Ca-activated chloride channel family protein
VAGQEELRSAARTIACVIVAAVAASSAAQAPVPQPARTPRPLTFGVGIDVINLNVLVTDGRNRYITDLAERDFAVFEDGIRQELSLFNHEDLPLSVILLIDTSASMEEKIGVAQIAATRFVKTLRPEDVAEVVQFNVRVTTLQEFTPDQAALEAAIRRTSAAGPTAMHNALYISLKDLEHHRKAGELRRRAIVLLSDGEDTASLVKDEQVLEQARSSEVCIYAISLRRDRDMDRERLAFSQAQHVLTAITRETGGQVFFPNSLSELDSVYDRVAEELRSQYNIGYVSSNKRKDGRWRRIVVRTPTRDDLQIRHKLGYYAPAS